MEITVASIQDLPAAVEQLLEFAEGGKKFTLTGDLGAGKTTFTQAFCRRFGVREKVTSPTFSLVNEYTWLDENGEEQTIHHLDLYRLNSVEEAHGIGIEDYLYDDCYCLIEWPEIIKDLIPETFIHLKITVSEENKRAIYLGMRSEG